jgi:hypothetical protein
MKKYLVTTWMTVFWYLLLVNVYAFDIPCFLRLNGGVRMWFSELSGDLVQGDRTKIDLIANGGLNRNLLVWDFFGSARVNNIHVFRFRVEPSSLYGQSANDSWFKVSSLRLGYDADVVMTPQLLFGANIDLDTYRAATGIGNVRVGGNSYHYDASDTKFIPSLGAHGTFYPIMDGIALRPNIFGRFNWWNYQGTELWDAEMAAGVDIPVNPLWTWTIAGGYRFWHTKFNRDRDTLDVNRTGFFLETSVLF